MEDDIGVSDIILSFIASVVLFVMGWKVTGTQLNKLIDQVDRAVLIYPHTTNWDMVIFVLYLFAFPKLRKRLYFVVKPQLFENPILARILKSIGAISSTKLEETGKGFIQRTTDKFQVFDDPLNREFGRKYLILISPEGTLQNSEWRSGYYYLAKNLEIPITSVGLDYKDHCIKIVTEIVYTNEHEGIKDVEKILKDQQMDIIPLYPEHSNTLHSTNMLKHTVLGWF